MIQYIQGALIIGLSVFVSALVLLAFLAPNVLMTNRIATTLWGKFESKAEVRKFAFLALVFFFIIGIYWAMRPLKDSIFDTMVGIKKYQPWAKILSLFFIVPLIIFYNKLIDKFSRNKLFYVLTAGYGVVALLFMLAFISPIGLSNTVQSPYRIVGWLWYIYIESFGSLIVALFWAYTSDITKPGAAKRGFPIIALLGQMGNILGPWALKAKRLGFASSSPIVGLLALLMFFVGFLLWIFVRTTPKEEMVGFEAAEQEKIKEKTEHKKEPGFLDGLKLLLSHGYLLGIACIIIFYEIIVTILDYFFKSSVAATYSAEIEKSAYLGEYAVWTGIVATLCVLLGVNNIQRKLGMKVSLVLMPLIVAAAVITLWVSPILGVAFWIMVFSKAVNYALNQPTLKQAYIPTTKESKYKAQSWIEMFGGRSSKAIGSGVNIFGGLWSPAAYAILSTTLSLGLVGVWVFVAIFVAKTYTKAIKENKVVC